MFNPLFSHSRLRPLNGLDKTAVPAKYKLRSKAGPSGVSSFRGMISEFRRELGRLISAAMSLET